MKTIPSLLLAATLLATLSPTSRVNAASASWSATAGGDWSNEGNWTPSNTYPGKEVGSNSDQIATFSQTSGTTHRLIELDVDVTLGGLVMSASASYGYTISSASNKALTFSNTTGEATLTTGGGGGNRVFDVGLVIDAETFSITARRAEFTQAITTDTEWNGVVNLNPNVAYRRDGPDIIILSVANSFSNGVLNLAHQGGVQLDHQGAAGGAQTAIHFSDQARQTYLALNAAGVANYGNQITVNEEAQGGIMLLRSGGTNTSTVGGIRLEKNASLEIRSNLIGSLNTSGPVHLGEGSLLMTQGDRGNNVNSYVDIALNTGAVLSGTGVLATHANGTSPNRAVVVANGAWVNPGDPATPGSTGILHLGNATYSDSKLTLLSGATLRFDIAGLSAGDEHDQIRVAGTSTLTLGGAIVSFNFLTLDFAPSDEVVLIDFASGAQRIGLFAGLDEGTLVSINGLGTAEFSYFGGDGNDIVLRHFQITPIPEPGTYFLLGVGLAAGALWRRRNRG